jgi:hypothetical protein
MGVEAWPGDRDPPVDKHYAGFEGAVVGTRSAADAFPQIEDAGDRSR